MDIKLVKEAVLVRAPVRRINPALEASLKEQIDSWLWDDVIAPLSPRWPAPSSLWPRRTAAPAVLLTTGS